MRRIALWLVLAPLFAACSDDKIGGVQGLVSADPDSLSFGKVFVGSSTFETVTLTNAGRTAVRVSVSDLPAGFEVKPAEIVVAGAGTATVNVHFAPSVLGEVKGDVVLGVIGAENDSIAIAVEGEAVERVLDYEEPLDFGLVEVGTTETKPLKLTSLVAFHLSAPLAVVGGNGADVYAVDQESLELDAGAETDLLVTFKPSRRGALNSFLEIRYCDGCAVTRIPLQGVGGVDMLDVDQVDFGVRSLGSETELPLTLHNTGDFPISIVGLDLGDSHPEFSILDPRPVELAPGDVETYTVALRAGDEQGTREGIVRFVVPGGGLRPEVVTLRATVGGIHVVATPEGQDFARQPVGVEATKSISFTNEGEKREVFLIDPVFDGGPRFGLKPVEPELTEGPGVPGGWRIDEHGTPVPFAVTFQSAEPGTFPGSLTFRIVNPDGSPAVEQPAITVPVIAEAVEPLPCTLHVAPDHIRFGAVRTGRIYKRDIVVTNVGSDECFIWNLKLEETTPRGYYALESDFGETTYVVPPGESLTARVMYAPRMRQTEIDEALFTFQQPAGNHEVRITGQSVNFNLLVNPNPIVVGTAKINERIYKDFSVSNMGSTTVTLDRIVVSGPDSSVFGLETPNPLPAIPGNGVTSAGALSSWFRPTDPGTKVSRLEIFVQGTVEPILVDVRGTGSTELCDEECAAPIATCPAPETVSVNTKTTLQGRATSPGGHNTECTWTVVQAPRGSRAQPGPGCTPDFTPDIVGDYTLELRVTDDYDDRNWDSCQTRITATANGGLWVEMFWDRAGDIDLHLLNVDMADPWQQASWWTQADCYYGNRNPTWDPSYPNASPGLDRDDIPGTGPENIRITSPAPHEYAVGVHNFSNRNGPIEVTTNVYCGGALLVTELTVFTVTKDFVILGLVDDICNWTPDGTKWSGFH